MKKVIFSISNPEKVKNTKEYSLEQNIVWRILFSLTFSILNSRLPIIFTECAAKISCI